MATTNIGSPPDPVIESGFGCFHPTLTIYRPLVLPSFWPSSHFFGGTKHAYIGSAFLAPPVGARPSAEEEEAEKEGARRIVCFPPNADTSRRQFAAIEEW